MEKANPNTKSSLEKICLYYASSLLHTGQLSDLPTYSLFIFNKESNDFDFQHLH